MAMRFPNVTKKVKTFRENSLLLVYMISYCRSNVDSYSHCSYISHRNYKREMGTNPKGKNITLDPVSS